MKPFVTLAIHTFRGSFGAKIGESGDDLDPVSVSGFGRLGRVGVDGGLTGSFEYLVSSWAWGILGDGGL